SPKELRLRNSLITYGVWIANSARVTIFPLRLTRQRRLSCLKPGPIRRVQRSRHPRLFSQSFRSASEYSIAYLLVRLRKLARSRTRLNGGVSWPSSIAGFSEHFFQRPHRRQHSGRLNRHKYDLGIIS